MNHWYSSILTILLSSQLFPQIFVSSETHIPQNFILLQNNPNPFNPETRFRYEVLIPGFFSFVIYNILGKQVASLVIGYQSAGNHELNWNANDSPGNSLPRGIYIAKLRSENQAQSIKLLLIEIISI